MMSLPNWPGADVVYSRAQTITTTICSRAYQSQRGAWKRKTGFRFSVPEDARDIIDAMNRGDENYLKHAISQNLSVIFPNHENRN